MGARNHHRQILVLARGSECARRDLVCDIGAQGNSHLVFCECLSSILLVLAPDGRFHTNRQMRRTSSWSLWTMLSSSWMLSAQS